MSSQELARNDEYNDGLSVLSNSEIEFNIRKIQEIFDNPNDTNMKELISVLRKLPAIIITILVFLMRFIQSLIIPRGGRGGSKKQKSKKSRKLRKSRK